MDFDFDQALRNLKEKPLTQETKVSGYTYSESNSDDKCGAYFDSSSNEEKKARTNSFESENSRDQLTMDIDLIT